MTQQTQRDNSGTTRRDWGAGTIVERPGRGFRVIISTGSKYPSGRTHRKEVLYRTREQAEAALPHLLELYGRSPDGHRVLPNVHVPIRRLTLEAAIRATIGRGRKLRWTDDFLARACVAAVAPARLKAGVLGPCIYCGDEFASTVDHIDPVLGDKAGNLASACVSCNAEKGRRTPEQWRTNSHDRFGKPR